MAEMIIRDIYVNKYVPVPAIFYVQATNTVPIRMRLMDYTPEDGAGARVYITRSDGTRCYMAAQLANDGEVPCIEFTPTTQTFPIVGVDQLQGEVYKDDQTLVSFVVEVRVKYNGANSTPSGDNINIFDDYFEQIEALQAETEELLEEAQGLSHSVELSEIPRISADAGTGKTIADLCEDWIKHRDDLYYSLDSGGNPNNLYTLWDTRDISQGIDDGKFQIDCSSFVLTILSGVSWGGSRYGQYVGDPEDPANLPHNITTEPWGMGFYADADDAYTAGMNNIRYANEIAKFAYLKGYAFKPTTDGRNLCVGDLVFITPDPSDIPDQDDRWEHISHVGIYCGKNITGYIRIANAVAVSTAAVTAPLDYSYWLPNAERIWGAARFPLSPSGKQLENIAINTSDLSTQAAEHEINLTKMMIPGKWYTTALKATRHAATTVRINASGSSNYIAHHTAATGQPVMPLDEPAIYTVNFRLPTEYESGGSTITVNPVNVVYLRNGAGDAGSASNWDYEWLGIYEGICDVPAEHVKTGQDLITPTILLSVVDASEAPQGYSISNQCSDAPVSGYYYIYKTHLNAARNLGSQEAIRLSDGVKYSRTLTSNGWSVWSQDTTGQIVTTEDISGLDCDNLSTGDGIGNDLTNGPHATAWCWIHTSVLGPNVGIQDSMIISTGDRYRRTRVQGTWGAWTQG